MDTKRKERRSLLRAERLLEQQGYETLRTRGSLGPVDIVAISPTHIKLIQVKSGTNTVGPAERERLEWLAKNSPENASVEIWRYRDRKPLSVELLA